MSEYLNIVIPASKILDEEYIGKEITKSIKTTFNTFDYRILKKSLDARNKNLRYNLRLEYVLNGKLSEKEYSIKKNDVSDASNIHIVGAGPAGYFAAIEAIENGLRPIVLERGKDVRSRRRDLKKIHQEHVVDDNSNYCFGEGGAGTYSDGKLYTRSKKRGNTLKVLEELVAFGAPDIILVEAHPHIGTNKLPKIITSIREYIIACGGEVRFDSKVTDFIIENDRIKALVINDNVKEEVSEVILATGHSARDIFQLLYEKEILLEAKNFAMGVRIEHSQQIIDKIQYHGSVNNEYLPPAAYSLVTQAKDRGVYSFCMCPGGIVAPCATGQEEVVTNGWSPSKRNNPYANSGIVVEVGMDDVDEEGPMALLNFQKKVERACWEAAGKTQRVPAQRMIDFIENRTSIDLPESSYQPGLVSVNLNEVLPKFICENLKVAFKTFGKKMKGYLTNDAILHAPESRTSSPIRIPRDDEMLNHPEILNLYPCGEGAGYAGGIVSAAVDGKRCVQAIIKSKA